MITRVLCISLVIISGLTLDTVEAGTDIWVNPANIGPEDGLAKATGYNTLWEGMAAMSPGDTVIIANGNWISYPGMNIDRYYVPPSGTPDNYSEIQAETDWEVRLPSINVQAAVRSYVEIRGIVFDSRANPMELIVYDWHHTKFIRCGFLAGKLISNAHICGFGSSNANRTSNHHNLMEECIAWGGGRYVFYSKYGQYNIFRRCVARHDYFNSGGTNPTMFANFRAYACDTHVYQNCISIDSDRTEYYTIGGEELNVEDSGFWLGDQYGATGNEIHGSISIKDLQMPYYIAGTGEGTAQLSNNLAINPVAGPNSAFIYENIINVYASNILGMNALGSGQDGFYGKSGRLTIVNSILKDLDDYGVWGTTNTYINHYNAGSGAFGEGSTTYDSEQNGLLYPVRIEAGSPLATAGSDGGRVGPEILYQIGRDEDGDGISGLLYGEDGWNEVQDGKEGRALRKLWPWPNEDKIKELMSETVEGVPGIYGFTAYQSPFGSPNTITSYIWEYLGNPIPPEIYGRPEITIGQPGKPYHVDD